MEIEKEIKEAQGRLSKLNLDFLDFVEKNPESLERSNFKLLELNDDLFTLQPWPTFINPENRNQFQEASLKLFALIKSIPRRVFNNDFEKMSQFYEIPVNTIERLFEGVNENDGHLDNLLGRGDFMLSPTGLKCLEYNFSASLGGWQVPIWESLYLNTPLIARFFREYEVKTISENLIHQFLEHVVHSSPEETFNRDGRMNIALVRAGFVDGKIATQSYLNTLYKEILRKKNSSLQGTVHMCDYNHLDIVDGYIFHKSEKIHTVIELYRGDVSPEIMRAFRSGNIRLMNGPVSKLLANKLNLALLSDHEAVNDDVFTEEEKEVINRYVPWTRKISPGCTTYGGKKIDLVDFILSHREALVIKPASGYGGKGVYLGRKAPEEHWEKLVKTAVHEKKWVVQELMESSPGVYQAGERGYDVHDMSWGFFVFGRRYAGVWVRVLPRKDNKGVINCHQGATVSVVFNAHE